MREPKRIVTIMLLLIVIQMAFMDYWSYSHAYHQNPDSFMDVLHHTALAPNQYRIGVMGPAGFIMKHSHLGLRHILTVFDGIAGLIAIFALFSLLERSVIYSNASLKARWFAAAVAALLFQFYMPWITWYQRPETMTTTALVALMLFVTTVRLPGGIITTAAAQLLLATMQSFVRADVPLAFFAGIFLTCLTPRGDGMSLPRRVELVVSALAVAIAVGVEYYLSHILFPYATYGDTPVFQLILQFKVPDRLFVFLLFALPYIWLVRELSRSRTKLVGPSAGIIFASAIFMGMWWIVGSISEVRIFMPFAIAVVPLTAETAIQQLLGEQRA